MCVYVDACVYVCVCVYVHVCIRVCCVCVRLVLSAGSKTVAILSKD